MTIDTNKITPETSRLKLGVVIASTRPGRSGLPIGQWVYSRAAEHSAFDVEMMDLGKINLPLMDEPNHPRLRNYTLQHTLDWSAKVDAADAFVFVMPEYNYAMTAPLKNAIDYLFQEWHYKPVGLVSYGGMSGGLRAAQMVKQVVTALKMMPLPEAVAIPFFNQYFDEEKRFQPNESMQTSTTAMLNELARWAAALKPLRKPAG